MPKLTQTIGPTHRVLEAKRVRRGQMKIHFDHSQNSNYFFVPKSIICIQTFNFQVCAVETVLVFGIERSSQKRFHLLYWTKFTNFISGEHNVHSLFVFHPRILFDFLFVLLLAIRIPCKKTYMNHARLWRKFLMRSFFFELFTGAMRLLHRNSFYFKMVLWEVWNVIQLNRACNTHQFFREGY